MPRKYHVSDGDVDMDEGPTSTQEDEDDGNDVPQTQVTIVNESDLQGSSKTFAQGLEDSDIS